MNLATAWACVAVAVRLAVWWSARDAGLFADMEQYHERAVTLLQTGTMPDALRGPGYPLALAAVYATSGISLSNARIFHAVAGGALALVAAWLARLAGAGRSAWVASAVVATYPGLVLSSVYLMPEGWYALLCAVALGIVASEPARGSKAPVRAAAAGIVAGAAILTRSVGMALLPALAAAVTWVSLSGDGWRAATTRLGALMLACLLTLLPWLAFTTRVTGGPLLDDTSGMNLLLGNHPAATGRLQLEQRQPLFDAHVAGAASIADANTRAMRAGIAWAAANPGPWTRLAVVKLGYLFGLEGREHSWVYSVGYFGARTPAVVRAWGLALITGFPLLALAACAGIAAGAAWRTPAGLATGCFVLATATLHVVSFGESRFHLPLIPVFAAWASVAVAARADGRRWSPAGTGLAVVLLVALCWGWSTQLRELVEHLSMLSSPDGWQKPLPY